MQPYILDISLTPLLQGGLPLSRAFCADSRTITVGKASKAWYQNWPWVAAVAMSPMKASTKAIDVNRHQHRMDRLVANRSAAFHVNLRTGTARRAA